MGLYINAAAFIALCWAAWWLGRNHPRAARVLTFAMAAFCGWSIWGMLS